MSYAKKALGQMRLKFAQNPFHIHIPNYIPSHDGDHLLSALAENERVGSLSRLVVGLFMHGSPHSFRFLNENTEGKRRQIKKQKKNTNLPTNEGIVEIEWMVSPRTAEGMLQRRRVPGPPNQPFFFFVKHAIFELNWNHWVFGEWFFYSGSVFLVLRFFFRLSIGKLHNSDNWIFTVSTNWMFAKIWLVWFNFVNLFHKPIYFD